MALVDLIMPKLGESIMEATILKWTKKVGEQVKQDETVLEIATDKVDSEVPSTTEGTLAEILFKENDVVPIGTVIARIQTVAAEQQSASPAIQPPATQAVGTIPETEVEHEIPYTPGASDTNSETDGNNNGFFSPLVLNIAKSEGVPLSELENIAGTGNEGRVTKKDILQFIADKKAGKVTKAPTQKTPQAAAGTTPPQPSTLPAPPAQPEAAPIPQPAVQPQPETVKTETVPQPEPQASGTSDNVEII